MTTKENAPKTDAKPKAAKAPVAKTTQKPLKKAESKQPAAKVAHSEGKTEVVKSAAKKPSHAAGKIKVTQMVGCIGREKSQRATLIGLGLNKRHRSRILQDTPEVQGMIYKVRHLVKSEKVN